MVWVNGKLLDTAQPKAKKWIPAPPKEKVLWGLCPTCGGVICEGDTVAMYGDHAIVACIGCFDTIPNAHVDCAGLRFPGETLSQ